MTYSEEQLREAWEWGESNGIYGERGGKYDGPTSFDLFKQKLADSAPQPVHRSAIPFDFFETHVPDTDTLDVHQKLRGAIKAVYEIVVDAIPPSPLRDEAAFRLSDALMACNRAVAIDRAARKRRAKS